MSWYAQVDVALPRHPRLLRLARRLEIPVPYAVGLLACIWAAAREHGEPTDLDEETLEDVAGWAGTPGALSEALSATGWVDFDDDGRVREMRGWERYEEADRRRERERERGRERRRSASTGRPADDARTSGGRPPDVRGPEAEAEAEAYTPPSEEEDARAARPPPGPSREDVSAVVEHYRSLGHPSVRTGSKAARSMVTARLREGRTVAELCRALDAMHADEWSQRTGGTALALERCMRTDDRVAQWLDAAASPPPGPGGPGGGKPLSRVQSLRAEAQRLRMVESGGGQPELPGGAQNVA